MDVAWSAPRRRCLLAPLTENKERHKQCMVLRVRPGYFTLIGDKAPPAYKFNAVNFTLEMGGLSWCLSIGFYLDVDRPAPQEAHYNVNWE